ncbi:MAG TPA: Uma2 family endonuclease, partial [Tepidiformaceae bacterium]|nr:Uma2 family endonuclease [Tepidiformaceae bacterium]
MASVPTSRVYVAEDLDTLPDGDRYEIIDGELKERIMSSLSSKIASNLVGLLWIWARANQPGHIMGADGGYTSFPWTSGDLRMPDVSYISATRVKKFPARGWLDIPPDLAVEVVSPTDLAANVQKKALDYVRAGVPLVWVVFPETRTVEVFGSAAATRQLLHEADTLTGEDVLPGFSVPVAELFAGLDDE